MTYLPHALLKNSKRTLVAVFFTLFLVGSETRADEKFTDFLGISGSLRPSFWNRDKSFSDQRGFAVGSAWLSIRPKEVAGFRLFAEGYVANQNMTKTTPGIAELREIYVERSLGPLDFKVGRFITVWGRGDKVNPTDSFTSKDLTFLTTDDEDQRRGQFSTQATYTIDTVRITGIWQPEWRAPKYPIAAVSGVSLVDSTPENSQNQFGIKIDQTSEILDWSLSYFNGFNRVPDFRIISVGTDGIQVGFDYAPIQVFGADFAKTVGDFGLRGEVAYTKTQDQVGSNPFQQNSNVFGVLGADRTFFDSLNLNAQVLYKNVLNFQDINALTNPFTQPLAQIASIISNQRYPEQFGLSLRPSVKVYNDTLEMEVAFVGWARNGDLLTRPKVTYAINDHMKGILGAEFYEGPQDSFFGRLKPVSSVFTEFRYLF